MYDKFLVSGRDGVHFETVTLVTHGGRPLASRCCRDTARAVVETHGADYVLSVKANCLDAFAQLAAVDWDADAVRRHADEPVKAHGRIEARRVAARDLLPDTLAPFPDARQAFRVVGERTDAKTGRASTENAYGITSVPAGLEPRPLAYSRTATTSTRVPARCDPPAWARTRRASAPATPRPTTPRSTTSCSPSSSTAASATCPRPTGTP